MPSAAANSPALLAEVRRGGIVESVHRGHVAVVDGTGRTIASLGDPEMRTFLRSAAKPFQAMPLLVSGAAEAFAFDDQEIAVCCASHHGQPRHTETVAAILRRMGLPSTCLLCGTHLPFDEAEAQMLQRSGGKPSVLQHNCSGKHAGFLAAQVHLGLKPENYLDPDGPLQRRVLEVVRKLSGCGQVDVAIDGCSAPNFALPVSGMARMFGSLASLKPADDPDLEAARLRIARAMTTHPDMVSAPGELDTELMRAMAGQLVCKIGAEGVWCAGVRATARWPEGLGIAFKIEDGSARARGLVALELVRQLGLIEPKSVPSLARLCRAEQRNHANLLVGEMRVAFRAV